ASDRLSRRRLWARTRLWRSAAERRRTQAASVPPRRRLRQAERKAPAHGTNVRASQYAQEIDQILLLLVRVPDIEAAIVEIDDLTQRPRRTVDKVRRSRGDAAELLHDDGAHIDALARDQGSAGILGIDFASQVRMRLYLGTTRNLEHRQRRIGGNVREIRRADIHPAGHVIVAGQLSVVAEGACLFERVAEPDVVDTDCAGNPERLQKED